MISRNMYTPCIFRIELNFTIITTVDKTVRKMNTFKMIQDILSFSIFLST